MTLKKNTTAQLLSLLLVFLFGINTCLSAQQSGDNDLISVIGTGDIMLGSNYPSDAKLPVKDGKELLSEVKDILKDADVTFGNLEGCFLDRGGNSKKCKSGCYFFRMPDRYVNYLVDAGFDVMSIANNHAGDFGAPGRENTQKILKAAGIHYAGLKDICETSRFERNGIKFGFAAFAPNTGTVKITDIAYAKKIVAELEKDCDIVIVSFHGGAEGKAHNRVTKKTETFYGENRGNVHDFAHAVIDAGADIVFGHGPHVVRATELYKDRFIIYSLGNFCTAGDFSISGISGYAPIVKVYVDKDGKFVKGNIFSAIQKDKSGPKLDANYSAAKEIKRLTNLDFPNTNLIISDEGSILRKDHKEDLSYLLSDEYLSLNPLEISSNHFPSWFDLSPAKSDRDELADNIIDFSKQYLGKPYRRGKKGPSAFDCSGFTHYVFKQFGYNLSGACVAQVHQGTQIDKKELQTGDLIFFKGRNIKSKRVGHVGIVIDNDGTGNVSFIHACNRGVRIDRLEESAYYKPRYVTGVRVLG
jgi:Putative enzyme of poly-gamma-glutamate biosynthesis (capsule formation)